MLEKNKNEFIEIYKENITRPGSDKLLNYLISEQSDFFTAPCSTRFHGSYAGGLVQHSINVYNCLKDYLSRQRTKDVYGMEYTNESIALTALLHDVCKMNFYSVDYRNAKNEQGAWEEVPYYTINEQLQYDTIWVFPVLKTEIVSEKHLKCFLLHSH